jgi:hypothetical protein
MVSAGKRENAEAAASLAVTAVCLGQQQLRQQHSAALAEVLFRLNSDSRWTMNPEGY